MKSNKHWKEIEYDGVKYPSIRALYVDMVNKHGDYVRVEESGFRQRLKLGMSISDSLFNEYSDGLYHGKRLSEPVYFGGVKYISYLDLFRDVRIKHPCFVHITYNTFMKRIKKGWNVEKAIFSPPQNHPNYGKIIYKGKTFNSYPEVYDYALECDDDIMVEHRTFEMRARNGWDVEIALITPPYGKKK